MKDIVFLQVVNRHEVLMIGETVVSQVIVALVNPKVVLKHAGDLLKYANFLADVDDGKYLSSGIVVEGPIF